MNQTPEDNAYDIAPRARPAPPPKAAQPLGYQTSLPPEVTRAEPEAIKNLYMPLWLLAGGVAVETVAAVLQARHHLRPAMIHVTVDLVLGTVTMLGGVLITAQVRHINLGSWGHRLLKLAAVAVAPSAAVTICGLVLDHIPFGGIVEVLGEFVLYFALLGLFFDMEESDTWYCVLVIFLIRLALYVALRAWVG